jgi:hypothetical protein
MDGFIIVLSPANFGDTIPSKHYRTTTTKTQRGNCKENALHKGRAFFISTD